MAFEARKDTPADFEARQLLRGFAAALLGSDRRIAAPYLAPSVKIPEGLLPPKNVAKAELASMREGAHAMTWGRFRVTVERSHDGRWFVTEIAARKQP